MKQIKNLKTARTIVNVFALAIIYWTFAMCIVCLGIACYSVPKIMAQQTQMIIVFSPFALVPVLGIVDWMLGKKITKLYKINLDGN